MLLEPTSWFLLLLLSAGCAIWLVTLIRIERRRRQMRSLTRPTVVEAGRTPRLH